MEGLSPTSTRPGPRRLTFVTSPDDCNLACRMCRDHSPLGPGPRRPPRRLSRELVAAVLSERTGSPLAEVIPSTRGEPLLWSGLDDLCEACAQRGLALNVTTNGTFPGRGGAAWAERLAPVARDVKVSWNAATPATAARLMAGLDLPAALAELRAFLRVRDARRARGERACGVSFQVTAQEGNVAELPAVVALAAELGVERVKVNQLQVHFPALAGDDLRRDAAARARWAAAARAMREVAAAHPLPGGGRVELQGVAPWPEDGRPPTAGPCPFLDREAWIEADGRFAPCPSPRAAALGPLGSVAERPLGELWAGPAYRALVREHLELEPCRECPFRRPGGY